uniref:Uncharacterized protein n=1 Tax=Heliothis virescens TaxID=7102 RepID=A0A2A4K6A8_HELVI
MSSGNSKNEAVKKERVKVGRVGDARPTAKQAPKPTPKPEKTQYEKDLEELERMKQEVREDMQRHIEKTPFVRRHYELHKKNFAPEFFEYFELYIYAACLIHPYPLCWKKLPDGSVSIFVRPDNSSILCSANP